MYGMETPFIRVCLSGKGFDLPCMSAFEAVFSSASGGTV